ncbi:MAG TPA: recombinase family protein [Xanthobacteraceae bacterium]|nr:recombinase family protein [Xanthobacteraceae bacterium]
MCSNFQKLSISKQDSDDASTIDWPLQLVSADVTMCSDLYTGEPQEQRASLVPAAQYLRQSDDHQKYSTENQSATNHDYAAQRRRVIVRTYCDDGISGLTFNKRDALRRLIEDVRTGNASFRVILVYDVSRWGRYQDPDEAAYYEFVCKQAGITVEYCAEPFENDGTPLSVIFKSMKRAMAGEYSRELSVKVFAGHARLVRLGYYQGGPPGYGLRRLIVDQSDRPKLILKPGEQKNITTDRVVLVPGDPEEIKTVRYAFKLFVHDGKQAREIAKILNKENTPLAGGRRWTRQFVNRLLSNERYVGDYVWNRQTLRLQARASWNSADEWIRVEGALAPLVSKAEFSAAQDLMRDRLRRWTEEEKLEPLRRILRKHGRISANLVLKTRGTPSPTSYARWFGGLIPAYERVGYLKYRRMRRRRHRFRSSHAVSARLSNKQFLEALCDPLLKHGYLSAKIIDQTEGIPSAHAYYKRFGSIRRVYTLLAEASGDPGRRLGHAHHRRPVGFTLNLSDEQLLSLLSQLLRETGCLTQSIINANKNLPASPTYRRRFGSMARTYQLIGYKHVPGSGRLYESRLSSRAPRPKA